jgi:hypothetical protein
MEMEAVPSGSLLCIIQPQCCTVCPVDLQDSREAASSVPRNEHIGVEMVELAAAGRFLAVQTYSSSMTALIRIM